MRIRSALPADAAAVVALRAVVFPYLIRGVEETRRLITEPPAGTHWTGFVAELDGQVVGWAAACLNTSVSGADFGELVLLHVHPDHRGRGAGAGLFAAAMGHLDALGVRRVRTFALPDSLEFARGRGFEPSREIRYSALDTRLTPAEQPSAQPAVPSGGPDGVRLAAFAEVDGRQLYAGHVAASADEPSDASPDTISYDTWRYEVWENVGLDRTASVAALVGQTVVAFTLVMRDGERMWSGMTATRPDYRGRGLARLVKASALRRAAALGVTVAYTANDSSNAPMLAVNTRLGYRPVATAWSCLKASGAA